jgi:hypothetical protein
MKASPFAPLASLALICFAAPALAQDATPLPEPSALLLKVKANQKHLQGLRHNYICKETDDSDEFDKNGAVKKHDTAEYDLYWQGHIEIRRMTSKNGKLLSAEELQKENDKIDRSAAKQERKLDEEDAKGDGQTIGIDTFLRASTFRGERRETYQGRPVIAMELLPNPDFKPSTTAERIVHLLSGTVWIDESAAQVVRLEAHLDKDFKMAGGLAVDIRKGSGAHLEQQRINDEVWMPSLVDVNIQGRALLFAGLRQHIIQHFSDYRKFRTETRIVSIEPTQVEAK